MLKRNLNKYKKWKIKMNKRGFDSLEDEFSDRNQITKDIIEMGLLVKHD